MAEVNLARGTTPHLRFKLPIPVDDIATAYITMKQAGEIVIDKEMKDCKCGGNIVDVHLTQAETLALSDSKQVEIQVRIRLNDGEAYKSKIFKAYPEGILKDGVI